MTIQQSQTDDLLNKKLASLAKTDWSNAKGLSNETISSPLLVPGSTIWQVDTSIASTSTLPTSNSSVVTVYRDSLSTTVQCTRDGTASGTNQTWLTSRADWIPPSFGSGYQIQLYAAPTGYAGNVMTVGISLPQAGSGNNDSWTFDYQAGVVNFADTTVPTAVTWNGTTGNVVYAVGARYTGTKGVTSFTSNTTFANLTVTNSASVGSTLYVNGIGNFNSNVNIVGNVFVGGNIAIQGNTGVISGNTGSFFGNASGFGALYAGIPSGYTIQAQTPLQVSANFNGYAQINLQNINAGSSASSDIVATADAGNANQGFIDMGINNSGFVGGAGNELNYPMDGYLYVHGTTNSNGNLLLGTMHQTDVVVTTDGFGLVNQQARFKNNVGLIIYQTTTSTSTSTGALQVSGGAGIVGNIYTGGTAYHPITATDIITPYQTNTVSFNSNTAVRLPTGGNIARPGSPTSGQIRYNTDSNTVEFYNGVGWIGVVTNITSQNFSGNGVSATFTLNQSTTQDAVLVNINGTLQQPGYGYTVTGNQITFSEVPLTTDQIDVRYMAVASIASNGTFSGDVSVTGNITLTGLLSAPQTTKASNAVGTTGQMCWDANYIYVCTATNTWKRSPLTGGY